MKATDVSPMPQGHSSPPGALGARHRPQVALQGQDFPNDVCSCTKYSGHN